MRGKTRIIIAVCLGIIGSVLFGAQEPDAFNSVERLENGWMRITGGDPYVIFNCANTPISDVKAVRITFSGKNVKNRHSYTELFWATDAHGYSEEYKGFFIAPYTVISGDSRSVILNFGEFLEAIGESGKRLHSLRIDWDKSIAVPQFQFQCTIELLKEMPSSEEGEASIVLHPSYLSRYLFKAHLFGYTIRHLVADFFTRVFRDGVFLLMYVITLGVTMCGMVVFRRKRMSAMKNSEETIPG